MGKSGGGGGGQPTQTTSTAYQTSIPEYAQPYVETMLGATQKQLFNMDDSGGITGFKPYKAYGGTYDEQGNQTSYDPSKSIAGFSPLQQQAQQGVAGLQTPGQFGGATALTGIAGMNAMGAGQNLQNTLTNPGAMQQYMNPYLQNALQPQLQEMQRQYDITGTQQQGQATAAGAFGGSRGAIMAAENERNKNMAMNQAIGQGYNQAFQNAQQQAGNVANMGLQGYQAAGQAGSALANIGAGQLASQQSILGAQNQAGAQQQAQQQQIINQGMQDYANQQQYPLMQLGVMSNMLRGLPMQAATTNQYVAAPNQVTQGIGLAGAGASIYNALKAKGGQIKEMAAGGIASYSAGDEVKSDLYRMPTDSLERQLGIAESESEKRDIKMILAQRKMAETVHAAKGGIMSFTTGSENAIKEDPAAVRKAYVEAANIEQNKIPENLRYDPEKIAAKDQLIKDVGSQLNRVPVAATPGAGGAGITENVLKRIAARDFQGIGGETSPTPAPAPTPVSAPTANPNANLPPMPTNVKLDDKGRADVAKQSPAVAPTTTAAPTGGIGIKPSTGIVPNIGGIKGPTAPVEETPEELRKGADQRVAAFGINEGNQKARSELQVERANAKDEARRITSLRMAEFFGAWGSTPGNTIVAGLNALKNKMPDFISDIKEETKIRRQIDKDIAELDKLDREEKNGIKKDYFKERSDLANRAMHRYGYELTAFSSAQQTAAYRDVGMAKASSTGSGKDDTAALQGRLNSANTNITKWEADNSMLMRKVRRGDTKAIETMNNDPQYKALIEDRDNIRKVLNNNKKVIAATSDNTDSGKGKIINLDNQP